MWRTCLSPPQWFFCSHLVYFLQPYYSSGHGESTIFIPEGVEKRFHLRSFLISHDTSPSRHQQVTRNSRGARIWCCREWQCPPCLATCQRKRPTFRQFVKISTHVSISSKVQIMWKLIFHFTSSDPYHDISKQPPSLGICQGQGC